MFTESGGGRAVITGFCYVAWLFLSGNKIKKITTRHLAVCCQIITDTYSVIFMIFGEFEANSKW